jgi:pyruvate-formate lyase-activating enzyme
MKNGNVETAVPSNVELEATNRCNTRCLHCPREAISRPLGTMSWQTFRTVADKLFTCRHIRSVSFSGMGEPTLNPLLTRFIAYLSGRFSTSLTTNASTLTSEMVEGWVDAGLGEVVVSFGGHSPELYRRMMGGLSLESAEPKIRDLVRLSNGRIRVSANVSVTLQNRAHLPQIRERLRDLGIYEIAFSLCHSRGGHLQDPLICDTPLPPVGDRRCDIFAATLYVAWNGKALACCHDLGGEAQVGDLLTEDLSAILGRRWRLQQGGVRFPMCKSCNDAYRFFRDPTPDRKPLSEWIYALYDDQDPRTPKLMQVVRRQESRIAELEQLVAGYERGRFMRLMSWVHRTRCQIRNSVLGKRHTERF